MADDEKEEIHPMSPVGGVGPGVSGSSSPNGLHRHIDKWRGPGPLGAKAVDSGVKLVIHGDIAAGQNLSQRTIVAINLAARKTLPKWRRYIAYSETVKVGGSLAWRANNPGNLRDASNKIKSVHGAVGVFAVFASLEDGRAAQRHRYLTTYGDMTVRAAINKLTPSSENDTQKYLTDLEDAGIELDGDVKSQIDLLMKAVQANEGLISGTEVNRVP